MNTIRTCDASAAAIQKFESMTGACCFVLDGTESQRVQDFLAQAGVIGIVPDPDGPELDMRQWRTSLREADVGRIFTEFCRIAGLLYNLSANPVHSAGVTGAYIHRYRQRRGKTPDSVFDIGFGYDSLGGMMAAAMYGTRYNGATMSREEDTAVSKTFLRLLNALRLTEAIQQSRGRLFWSTPFGEGKLPEDIGQFQLVFAHTVLEHVVNLPAFLSDARRVLAPDGCFISYVDLSGHEKYPDLPLDFLCWPQEKWDALVTKTIANSGHLPCRRERLPWYLQQLREAGFTVEFEVQGRLIVPERIGEMFPGEDLTPEGVILYCEKT
jgi:SAM-dependent methyltransferase